MMRVGTPTPMDGSHLTVAASSAPSSALRRSQRLLEAAASRRKQVARVLWGTVVFLCVLGCLSQVFIFLDIFWKFPTIIEIETERTDELDFPGITICNNNRFRVSAWCNTFGDATCDKSHVKTTAMDESLAKMNRSVRIAMGHQRQTMIFETSKVVNGTIEVTDQQAFRDSFFHLKYSNCFAYNVEWTGSGVRDAERARQIDLQVILFLEQREYKEGTEWPGAQIVFHDAEVIPDPEESGIPLRAGHNYIFTLRQMVTKRLPWPYWTRCINYPFVRRGRYIMKMTKPLCEKECAYNASLTMCRCIRTDVALPYEVEWDREPSGRRRFCDSDIALTRCWVKVLDEMERCQKKHCRRACLETQFETSVTQDPWPDELFFKQESEKYAHINITSFQEARMNLTRIYVIYGTLNRITYRHRPKYEQIELFSYMGGFIGIWIGVSFLNVLDYGSRFVSWAIHRCKEGKRNSRATTPQRIDSPVDHKVKTLQVQKAPNGYHGEQTW